MCTSSQCHTYTHYLCGTSFMYVNEYSSIKNIYMPLLQLHVYIDILFVIPPIALQIRDGASPTSPLLTKLCGKGIPSPITSTGNALWLYFRSDALTTRSGFQIMYQVEHLTAAQGKKTTIYWVCGLAVTAGIAMKFGTAQGRSRPGVGGAKCIGSYCTKRVPPAPCNFGAS